MEEETSRSSNLPLFDFNSLEPQFSNSLFESPTSSSSPSFTTAPPETPSPQTAMPPFISRSSSFSDLPPTTTSNVGKIEDLQAQPPSSSSATSFSTHKQILSHQPDPPLIDSLNLDSHSEGQEEIMEEWNLEGKKAFGPAAGRDFLARHQQQQRQAEEMNTESGFSIRERIPVRPSVNVPPSTTTSTTNLERKNTNSTTTTTRSPTSYSSRRKPVPAITDEGLDDTPTPRAERQGLRRDPILNATPTPIRAQTSPRRAPPISGLNSTVVERNRLRKGSSGSSGSVSKDSVLRNLSEAIRKERRRKEMFQAETVKAKAELEEIEGNFRIMREKSCTLNEQQELTIKNLRLEIEEIQEELASADVLDEATAQEYLSLLSNQSLSHLALSNSQPVDAFDPSLLRSTSTSQPNDPPIDRSSSLRGLLKLKRGLTLRRRIETHLAAHDPVSTTTPSASVKQTQERVHNFTRENLSTSSKNIAARQSTLTREQRSTAPPPAPAPRPIFSTSALSTPSMETFPARPSRSKPSRGRPPVSGVTKNYSSNGAEIDSGAQDESKGFKGRLRKRSNSLKEGFSGTMRVLFPSNAPPGQSTNEEKGETIDLNNWLRAA
ncbi:hypothetical protein JCM3765_004734 [Sporobolomyces pararoseus]